MRCGVFQPPSLLDPCFSLLLVEPEGIPFRTDVDDQLLGASVIGDHLSELDILGVPNREGLDPDHFPHCLRYAAVDVPGGIGEDFFGEIVVVVRKIPDISSVHAGQIDGQADEILVADEKIEGPDDQTDDLLL